jgi:hypothetical protein
MRETIYGKLHEEYAPNKFDNADVWAGNMRMCNGGVDCNPAMARLFLDPGVAPHGISVTVSAELYIRGVTEAGPIPDGDIDVALWTDANRRGFTDQKGRHYPDFGYRVRMRPAVGLDGGPLRIGNNAVFESVPLAIEKTGVFSFTVLFSADGLEFDNPAKKWISINEIAQNIDGLMVVSPSVVRVCPSLIEICVRKYGARIDNGKFVSGMISNVTRDIDEIPVDVLYLLPIFEPGTGDILTGEDCRKGTLGSIYAVKDFFRIDPALVTPPRQADLAGLAVKGLITDYDLVDLLDERHNVRLSQVSDFHHFKSNGEIVEFLGDDIAAQIVGRAELRELVIEAHKRKKLVIFDLVLMQTSRDSRLILEHRDWYALDENGAPKRHSIAWLDYSDVALFDLLFNRPLQDFLSAVAPYWIRSCGLDGVRIDASQTVDRAFLKQIKNRINDANEDAIVVGETLCPMCEATDVPVDIIYSLFVDHHVHIESAIPYYDLFETYSHTFPRGTHAMAYFENHDSARATKLWLDRYEKLIGEDPAARKTWAALAGKPGGDPAETMAALKNIQCTLINMISGTADAVNFCYAIENGSDFAETTRTDFERETIIDFSLRRQGAGATLHGAYAKLHELKDKLGLVCGGHVWYLRENLAPGADDRVFALIRYDDEKRLLFVANLDPAADRGAKFSLGFLELRPASKYVMNVQFDTYELFGLREKQFPKMFAGAELSGGAAQFNLMPLQSVLISF